MSRDGFGIYSKPAGTTAVSGTTIDSAKYNATIDDIVSDLNAARPITAGGTGATSAPDALVNLGANARYVRHDINTQDLDNTQAENAQVNMHITPSDPDWRAKVEASLTGIVRVLDIDTFLDTDEYSSTTMTIFAASGSYVFDNTKEPLSATSRISIIATARVRHEITTGDDIGFNARLEYFDGTEWVATPQTVSVGPIATFGRATGVHQLVVTSHTILGPEHRHPVSGFWAVRWRYSNVYAGTTTFYSSLSTITEFEPRSE